MSKSTWGVFRDFFSKPCSNILRTASGEKTKSELLNVGRFEFVPWQIGVMS